MSGILGILRRIAAKGRFNSRTRDKVSVLAQILRENQPLSVRGAMYRGIGILWKDSSNPCYRQCGALVLKMRRLGLVPYPWIVDGTRSSDKPSSWSGLADFAETVAHAYRKDLWERQKDYVVVFTEKDAMSGVIRPVTHEYDVQLNPIRGDISETFVWSIAEEWKEIQKPIYAYYLGDHDPKGFSIEANLRKRLLGFCGRDDITWIRLAITEDDFHSDLLGFPIKLDKRGLIPSYAQAYHRQYGDRCVEVDAIPAPEIRERVREAIESHINQREWKFLKAQEAREKQNVFHLVKQIGEGDSA